MLKVTNRYAFFNGDLCLSQIMAEQLMHQINNSQLNQSIICFYYFFSEKGMN
jgi:hypothetical protein